MRGGFICEGYASKVPYPKNGLTKPPPPLQAKERSSAEIASVYARCPRCNQVHIPHCEAPHGSSQTSYPTDPQPQTAAEGARSRPITIEEHERKPPAPSSWGNGGWSESHPPRASYQPEAPTSAHYPPTHPPVKRDAPPPHEHQPATHQQQDPSRQPSHRVYHQPPPQTMSQPASATPAPVM